MTHSTATSALPLTLGLDLGKRKTQVCVLGIDGAPVEQREISTNRAAIEKLLGRFPGSRVVLEASTSDRWIAALAESLGHETVVANPRRTPILTGIRSQTPARALPSRVCQVSSWPTLRRTRSVGHLCGRSPWHRLLRKL